MSLKLAYVAGGLAAALLVGACSGAKTARLDSAPSTSTAGSGVATTASPPGTSVQTGGSTAVATTAQGVDPSTPEVNPSGDIPDNQVFIDYLAPTGSFAVKVPEGWSRTASGVSVTFTDKLNSITMTSLSTASPPTVDSAKSQDVPAIQAASTHFEAGAVTQVTRKAGAAVLITYRADAAPDPVTGKVLHDELERYAFWRNGTEVVLTLAGPQGADNVDPWKIVTDGFRWTA